MLLLDLSLPDAADNLALDEALLHEAEHDALPSHVLRLWEFSSTTVVLGRGGRVPSEVHRDACERDSVPILRRTSGGGTVVAGPGCLMYSLIMRREGPLLQTVSDATSSILQRMANGLRSLAPDVTVSGISDLCVVTTDRDHPSLQKFSGNSMRLRPSHLLFHGTILYGFPLAQISQYLRQPLRQPAYRAQRPHDAFVTNLATNARALRTAIAATWSANDELTTWPATLTRDLAQNKYRDAAWNFRL